MKRQDMNLLADLALARKEICVNRRKDLISIADLLSTRFPNFNDLKC